MRLALTFSYFAQRKFLDAGSCRVSMPVQPVQPGGAAHQPRRCLANLLAASCRLHSDPLHMLSFLPFGDLQFEDAVTIQRVDLIRLCSLGK